MPIQYNFNGSLGILEVEMAAKKGASAAAKKRVLAVRKGATWGK